MTNKEFLWTEKYRPHRVADTILPMELKSMFQAFVDKKNISNMILTGPSGVGKTTVAKAMLDELGADYITINGSLDKGIDILRTTIMNFASAVSFSGGRKYVIIDEADYLNASSTQPALRNFIETFSENCGFILTCNYKNRLIKELHSRATVVEFKIGKTEAPNMAKQIFNRMVELLTTESVEFDKSAIVEVIKKYYPDQRRIINELQRYSATGKIDLGILNNMNEVTMTELMRFLKEKNFTLMRKWVTENLSGDHTAIFRSLYENAAKHVTKDSVPQMVIILADYQYKAVFVADQEINIVACLTEIMVNCTFQ